MFTYPGANGDRVVGTAILPLAWTAGEDTVRSVLSAMFFLRTIVRV
jgi:hypothetical protein